MAAAEQNHVMRAGDGVDAVDLHKTDAVDEIGQRLPRGRTSRSLGQRVTVQKQAAGSGVGKQGQHGAMGNRVVLAVNSDVFYTASGKP